MTVQVCAATVAYNNPKELTRLLSSLTNQGLALRGLIVIDNSDHVYTAENKKVFDTHSKQYPFAYYHKTKSNVGSAGGFRHGMKIAHENGFDWIWPLDQDGVASDLCLTELLKRAGDGDILCPKKVDIDRPRVVFTHKRLKKNFFGHLCPVRLSADKDQIDAFGTHGVLISKKVMDSIGYYDACNFFVGLEDYDYARRARQAKFAIIPVDAAEVRHPDLRRKKAMREAQLRQDATSLQSPEQHTLGPTRLHGAAISDESEPVVIDRIRPEHLGYIPNSDRGESGCKKGRSLLTFSWFYFFTESLTRWQFAIAFVYSLCVLFIKFARENEICVKKTLNAYVKCLASNMRQEWPYGCVEEFCRHILE
jgi:rhamnopyranosyl-N-acetylglucosaminyl-diphospho-decaprenol beta-1,3/1,4-galactofuranosyltransferase